MSVQFYKILAGVFLAHLVVLTIVWIGFSAPNPRPRATFTYEGALPAEDTGSDSQDEDAWQKDKASGQFALDHHETSYFNHWIELRDPSKSFTYDHLGF